MVGKVLLELGNLLAVVVVLMQLEQTHQVNKAVMEVLGNRHQLQAHR
jgi:hypothetical protein